MSMCLCESSIRHYLYNASFYSNIYDLLYSMKKYLRKLGGSRPKQQNNAVAEEKAMAMSSLAMPMCGCEAMAWPAFEKLALWPGRERLDRMAAAQAWHEISIM